jgi:DNA repair photolyase
MNHNLARKNEVFGTREWAKHTVNCCTGCAHDCRYCYAKSMAIRFGRVFPHVWKEEQVRWKDVNKRYREMDGTVMFPSSHDITPGNFDACYTVLRKLLEAGNQVLVVSKPHLECISGICEGMRAHRDRILFRFTIGALDDGILSFWEPNAPTYAERRRALEHAFQAGFATSVSVEPMLDSVNIDSLIQDLSPFITDALWIGKMNDIRRRVKIEDERTREEVSRIEAGQTDERVLEIYERHKNNPLIKWKESIKKVVDMPLSSKAGMDE